MARKSKRMALNDAIRRGQARIAEDLRTGQMGSNNVPAQKGKESLLGPEKVVQFSAKSRSIFLKSEEKSKFFGKLPPKKKLIVLFCVALIVVLTLVAWLVSLIGTEQTYEAGGTEFQKPFVSVEERSDSSTIVDEKEPLLLPEGDNVIWIQSIPISRKGELNSLEVFFENKGIQTRVIEVKGSNLAVLVTRDGFESNPGAKGTEGHRLLERIKQLGPVYVEETKDTKFGLKPFQDALGYKLE